RVADICRKLLNLHLNCFESGASPDALAAHGSSKSSLNCKAQPRDLRCVAHAWTNYQQVYVVRFDQFLDRKPEVSFLDQDLVWQLDWTTRLQVLTESLLGFSMHFLKRGCCIFR